MASFPLYRAELVSLFIEAILYGLCFPCYSTRHRLQLILTGLYTASFACTIYVLIYKRSSRTIHYGMFFVTVVMFALATIVRDTL
jgi:hypothetical protein